MPEIKTLVPKMTALEYDGTNGDECGSFYAHAQRIIMTGQEDQLWIRFGPELANGIYGPIEIGTVLLRQSEDQQQYNFMSREVVNEKYLALVDETGETLAEPFPDPMS